MITVSLCMIVKNEEETLARCLRSVKDIVDEIVIIDTGSDDGTKQIAAEFTDKILDFTWVNDFSAARNFAFEQAEMDYILWLDSDDILLPEDAEKFKRLKQTLSPGIDGVMMKYNTGFDSAGRVTFSYYRERLSRRSGGFKWIEPVHEYLDIRGSRITSDICVTHAKPHGRPGGRNLHIYEGVLSQGGQLSPRGMYYYARELRDNGRHADAAEWFTRFLDGGQGWVEDNISACGELAQCLIKQNMTDKALSALLRSFRYDSPRPEICCQLGYHFKQADNYPQAAFWFELALSSDNGGQGIGFRREEYHGYIPCIELAVCHDKMGEYQKAAEYNDMALKHNPDSAAAIYNKKYFDNRLSHDCTE